MYHQILTPNPSTTVVLRDARGRPVGVVVSPRQGPDLGPGGRTVLLSRTERIQEQQ
jgi:hypothetical protein